MFITPKNFETKEPDTDRSKTAALSAITLNERSFVAKFVLVKYCTLKAHRDKENVKMPAQINPRTHTKSLRQ